MIIQLSDTEEEVSQQPQIQIYLSPEIFLETMREALRVEKKEDSQKVPKLLTPSLWRQSDEPIFQEITFIRVE